MYFLKRDFDYTPGVVHKGGGTSGQVGFPDYMEETHQDFIGYGSSFTGPSIFDVMESGLGSGGDPYISWTSEYDDPSSDVVEFEGDLDEYRDSVMALDHQDDWEGLVDAVLDKIDSSGMLESVDTSEIATALRTQNEEQLTSAIEFAIESLDDGILDDLVRSFDRRSAHTKARSIREFSSQMADINAVQSSAFLFGLALIESEHIQSVNEFNKEVTKDSFDRLVSENLALFKQRMTQEIEVKVREEALRAQIAGQHIQITYQQLMQNTELKRQVANLNTEMKRIKFVMNQEYVANSADMDAKSAMWDFKVYEYGVAYLGGLGGGAVLPDKPSKASSSIGGALSGAASGAMMGSVVPGIGPAVGAGVGALMGLGSGLLS